MLSPYLKKADTTSLSSRINLKLNAVDTASLSSRINLKLNAADTLKYVKYADTVSTIGTKANLALKLNAADTASLSNRIDQVGLPQSGNTAGTMLFWDGSAWVRLAAGTPGQVLYINNNGLPAWGNFSTPSGITTTAATAITDVSAQTGGTITGMGGAIVEFGIVYGTAPNPLITGSKIVSTGNPAMFSTSLTGLNPGTTYYMRTYVTSLMATNYGNEVSFTTNITSINCAGATPAGNLVAGVPALSVSSAIPYVGGNGGTHSGQLSVPSTGVIGLTATLAAGTFSGPLTYTITGTPGGAGTASFAINIGGRTCTLDRTVVAGQIASIDCAGAVTNGTLVHGLSALGVSSVISYTGGNGGSHSGQTVNSTGVSGLTATLTAGNFVNGNGTLNYVISGTPTSSGTARFAINIGGQTCELTRTVVEGSVATLTCGSPSGTLVAGLTVTTSVTFQASYTGGNGGAYSEKTINSTGVTGLTAVLTAGTFASGSGILTLTITGTPSGSGNATFLVNVGGQTCSIAFPVNPGLIGDLNNGCIQPTLVNGTLVSGVPSVGAFFTLSYTGGNGGLYNSDVILSGGVSGLTATLPSGRFTTSTGNLTFTVGGTPTSSGTASFTISIGGRTCTFNFTVSP